MDNVDIIKKRLRDLKELSESLKNKTVLDQSGQDIVKLVMQLTRDVNPRQDRNTNSVIGYQLIEQKKMKRLSINRLRQSNSQNSSIPIIQQSVSKENNLSEYINDLQSVSNQKQSSSQRQRESKYHQHHQERNQQNKEREQKEDTDKRLFKKWQSSNQKSLELQNLDENDNLDGQNLDLNKIRKKGQKLRKFSQEFELKQMFKSSDNSNHLTYHKIEENVEAFLTKIQVMKSDFPKIDYISATISLQLDFILFKQQNEENSLQKTIRLSLTDISAVEYFDPNVIILIFEQNQGQSQSIGKKSLFIKCNSSQQRRRWDIGIYMNMTLIKLLKRQKMFESEKPNDGIYNTKLNISNNNKNISSGQQKIMNGNANVSNIKKEMQQNKSRQQEAKNHNQKRNSKKQKISQTTERLQTVQKQRESGIQKQKQKNYAKSEQINKISSRMDFSKSGFQDIELSNGWEKFIEQSINKKWQEQKQRRKQSQFSMQNTNKKINSEAKIQRLQQSLKRQSNESEKGKEKLKNQQLKREQQEKDRQLKRRYEEEKRFVTAKNILKSGFFMVKYSQGAVSPHQKKVYLSEDEKKLCWQDRQKSQIFKNQPKYASISNITSVDLGVFGPGIQKHTKKKDIDIKNCYVTIKLKNQNRKQLQFGIPNGVNLLQQFVSSLNILLQKLKNK